MLCLQEYLCPLVVQVKESSLNKRGQNWHLLVHSHLVLEVRKVVKDLERSGQVLAPIEMLLKEVLEKACVVPSVQEE